MTSLPQERYSINKTGQNLIKRKSILVFCDGSWSRSAARITLSSRLHLWLGRREATPKPQGQERSVNSCAHSVLNDNLTVHEVFGVGLLHRCYWNVPNMQISANRSLTGHSVLCGFLRGFMQTCINCMQDDHIHFSSSPWTSLRLSPFKVP